MASAEKQFDTDDIWRQKDLECAQAWAPAIEVHYIGADKYIACITSESPYGGNFCKQFSINQKKEFREVKPLNEATLFVRCPKPLNWVKEEIMIGFLPF